VDPLGIPGLVTLEPMLTETAVGGGASHSF